MNFIKPNLKSLPEQVDINTNDIKNLKSIIKSSYKTEKELETTTIAIPITDTNAPQDTTSGWLFDSVGHLFSINGGDGTNLLLEYYTNFRGPAGVNGVAVVQTTGSSTESVMSQNAVTTELESKANLDASNLSPENVTSWNNKLGIGTITTELESKANLDASNLSGENVTSWANKFFPVGSIYMSVNNTSPASFLGGTWEQILGKFLLSSDDVLTDGIITTAGSYHIGDNGGSADAVVVSHTHTLRSLTDNGFTRWGTNVGGSATYVGPVGGTTTYDSGALTMWNDNTGVDGTGKNMPPYLVVYMWKRIA